MSGGCRSGFVGVPGVLVVAFLEWDGVEFTRIQFSLNDRRLSCYTLWGGQVGVVCRPSFSGGGFWAGSLVRRAGEGVGVGEAGVSGTSVLGASWGLGGEMWVGGFIAFICLVLLQGGCGLPLPNLWGVPWLGGFICISEPSFAAWGKLALG